MKQLFAAAALALLTAGQAQTQVFNPDASPEQVGNCVADIEIAAMFVEGQRLTISNSARTASLYYVQNHPDGELAAFDLLGARVQRGLLYILTGATSDAFNDIERMRERWAVFAVTSQECKFAMGMTPADAWPEFTVLLKSMQ